MNQRWVPIATLAVFALVIAFLHLRPLLVWQLQLGPALAAEPHADRLEIETLREFPQPPASWRLLRAGNLSLRAPLLQDEATICRACRSSCLLRFANGSLAVLPETSPASYANARASYTPDAEDLSPWRWSWQNWGTLDALEARVRGGDEVPDAFRFEAPGSRGIVTLHLGESQARVLIYAYAADGSPARVVGLTDVERDDAEKLIGTIRVEAAATAPAVEDCGGEALE